MGNLADAMREWELQRSRGPNLEECAEKLGGEVDGDFILCPSPGKPPDDRSCSLKVHRGGFFFIYDCEGSLGAAYRHVRQKLALRPRETDHEAAARHLEFAQRLLDKSMPARGTAVERYLRSRAITLLPECLRFYEFLEHKPSGSFPAGMVVARTAVDGSFAGIHRTYLMRDGSGKAPVDPQRMDLGRSTGSAIRLSPVAEELLIGEGIETTLSVMQVKDRPGWAAGSAVMMRKLELPREIRSVILLADGDVAGEAAAMDAALRWRAEGRHVRIARAPRGHDFNDVLQQVKKNV